MAKTCRQFYSFCNLHYLATMSNTTNEMINNPLFAFLADEVNKTNAKVDTLVEKNRYLHARIANADRNIMTLNQLLMEYESRMAAMESVIRRMLEEPVGGLAYTTQAIVEQEIQRRDNVTDDLERLLEETNTESEGEIDLFDDFFDL